MLELPSFKNRHLLKLPLIAVATATLLACGGGGEGPRSSGLAPPNTCGADDLKTWLSSTFDQDYFWYRLGPRPNPISTTSVSEHFDALLYTGTDSNFPADRWSNFESTESFNRFYGDGQSMGYGLSVAGLEVAGTAGSPLYVRSVDPASPAATAGLVRGDQLLSLNSRSAADIVAANDFGALTAGQAGQTLSLQWRTAAGATRTATLAAAVYALAPVPRAQTLTSPLGRKLGYVEVRNMISQVSQPLQTVFTQFRADGVQDIVLDLRYNGGGLVSTGATVASYVAGSRAAGQVYASLLYNDKRAASNQSFLFANPAPAAAASVPRVYVLMGRRTCSASEQVINGLRGAGIDVVAIGEATCGKPVGSVPVSDSCSSTYSIVNFESVNKLNQGRYFTGFAPTCSVAEDFTQAQGSAADPLTAVAASMADGAACPTAAQRAQPLAARGGRWLLGPAERADMIAR
jgi:carboxyl-terminal processing protease